MGQIRVKVFFENFNSLFLIVDGYYAGVAGGVCKDETHVIKTREECEKALLKLGYQISGRSFWTGRTSTMPSGCSIRNGGDKRPYFEKSTYYKGKGRKDLIPICNGNPIPDFGNTKI